MDVKTDSSVEKKFLEESGYEICYTPTEKIGSVVVDTFPSLGKLTALRFIEWAQKHEGGLVSLPTGKTPEHFISRTTDYLNNWDKKETAKLLEENGISLSLGKPKIESLRFIQIDEFYPISPTYTNSFYHYVKKYYLSGFGFKEENAMLMDIYSVGIAEGYTTEEIYPDGVVDLSLRTRRAKTLLEEKQRDAIRAVDEYCMRYEEKIRKLGGIGFFLGGIGPDGHIAFNVKGSDFYSTTRLTGLNYETAAASAGDLGGIESSRNRLAVTIGLETIRRREDVTAIIMAAGEAKASVVADSIENNSSVLYPASSLHGRQNARFYLTKGAASRLIERRFVDLASAKNISTEKEIRVTIDSFENNSFNSDNRFISTLINKTDKSLADLKRNTEEHLIACLNKGLAKVKNERILHTSPHHDDEMLGYLPYLLHLIREPSNEHFFSYMTGGFTSVTNGYIETLLSNLKRFIETPRFFDKYKSDYFAKDNETAKSGDIYLYLDGVASETPEIRDEALALRFCRILSEVYDCDIEDITKYIDETEEYLKSRYPGKKDEVFMQKIKSMVREWEAELVWGYFGFNTTSVKHLRMGFYTGDIFTKDPSMDGDVKPVLELLRQTKPTIITVALDPEGSGPDTHYKVLQAISGAVKLYEKESGNSNIKIWGYRNVWYRFHPAEANISVPVSLNSMAVLSKMFLTCFGSQKDASFPSYEHDGPFSELAQKILVEQYERSMSILGRKYFYENTHPRIRACRGLALLRELSLEEFYEHSNRLKDMLE